MPRYKTLTITKQRWLTERSCAINLVRVIEEALTQGNRFKNIAPFLDNLLLFIDALKPFLLGEIRVGP